MSSRFNEAWFPRGLVSYNSAGLWHRCPRWLCPPPCWCWAMHKMRRLELLGRDPLLLLVPGKLLSFYCCSFSWETHLKLVWNLCPSVRFVQGWAKSDVIRRKVSKCTGSTITEDGIFGGSRASTGDHLQQPPGNLVVKIAKYWGMLYWWRVNEITALKLVKERGTEHSACRWDMVVLEYFREKKEWERNV